MALAAYLAEAGLLDLSLSFVVEVIVFVLMVAVLGRWAYPRIIAAAEARQRQIDQQLEAAEKARQEAEQRLQDAEKQIQEARQQAGEILAGAAKSGDQLRAELREKAEADARRLIERARQEIETERKKAVDSVRGQVADLVVAATEKVVGESLDGGRHLKLIEKAIAEVGKGGRGRG